jgi:hypothetical protein
MWKQRRRFSALDRDSRWMFVRATLLLPLISLSLWIWGFRFTQAALKRFVSSVNGSMVDRSSDPVVLTSITHKTQIGACMVRAAARHSLITSTCLEESLALWFLLRREGIEAELRIGARKIADKFEAHAWVECHGEALNQAEDPHGHYAIFEGPFSPVVDSR